MDRISYLFKVLDRHTTKRIQPLTKNRG